jgi:anti-sigma B factor antagonist
MSEFSITQTHRNDIAILEPSGYLDLHTVPEFENAIRALLGAEQYKIIVDMNKLTYISSAGLGVFMGFIEEIREHNGDIKLCALPPRVFKVFDLLGFPTLFNIYDTLEEALAAFA